MKILLGWCMDGNHSRCVRVTPEHTVKDGRGTRVLPVLECKCHCHNRHLLG
jgi:hypothetical protein